MKEVGQATSLKEYYATHIKGLPLKLQPSSQSKKGSGKRGSMKVLGKDLRLVKLNEEISGKEKVWLRMILKEPRRNFLKLPGSR